jgi:hypothetical protein
MISLSYNGQIINQRESDGYINATQMCQANGKLVADWTRLKETKDYIAYISSDLNIPTSQLVVSLRGNSSNSEQGTWIHPLLALKLARWISIELEVWCDLNIKPAIVNNTKDKTGFIYLVKATNSNFCKIGLSKTPLKRMSKLQTGNAEDLTVLHLVFVFNAKEIESSLHKYYSSCWTRGEWFDIPEKIIKEFPSVVYNLNGQLEQLYLS